MDSNDEIYRGVQEPMKKWLVSFDAITVRLSCLILPKPAFREVARAV